MGELAITVFSQQVDDLDRALAFFERMGKTGLFPDGIKCAADALMVAAAGKRFGFDPLESLQKFHVVKGRVSPSSDTRAGILLGSPLCLYLRCVSNTDTECTYTAARSSDPDFEVKVTYTQADAVTAGLWGRGTWAKHPKAMLRARCVSIISRQAFPDLLAGVYDPDEALEISGAYDVPKAASADVTDAEFEPDTPEQKERLPYGNRDDFVAALEGVGIPVQAVSEWRKSIGKDALNTLAPFRLNNVALSLLGKAAPATVIERRTDFAMWLPPDDGARLKLFLRLFELSENDLHEWLESAGCDIEDGERDDKALHEALLKSPRFAAMTAARLAECFEAES